MNRINTALTGDELNRPGFLQKLLPMTSGETDIPVFNKCAASYLLKPADEVFPTTIQNKNSLQKTKLCIPSLRGFQLVEINAIIYCEASSNYTNIHFINRPSICTPRSIYEYEEQLADCNFVRIHRSFIVNLAHINEYIRGEGGSVILSNGHEVEVSRRKKDMLMTRMKEYYKF